MINSNLNYFVPYENAAAWYENQLTRALLVVLRYSPMAHEAWLGLVAPSKQLHGLSKPQFALQRGRVLDIDVEMPEGERIPGISVWLAPDAVQDSLAMEDSNRQQVLDGIINYGNDLVVVIENKIGWGAMTEQPHRINRHGSPVNFEGKPCAVSWQRLLEIFFNLVERGLVSGSEGLLIADFLDYVEEHFPHIGPYSTLGRCGINRFRVERRLDTIIGLAMGTEVGKAKRERHVSGTAKIAEAWLEFSKDHSTVYLSMYPGDTLAQSRALYTDRDVVNAVLDLRAAGWRVEPNFHWGFMTTGYAWTSTPLRVEGYCDYWVKEIGATRELERVEWDTYWAKLESAQIVEPEGKRVFDANFTASKRMKAHPRPGLYCQHAWNLADARASDATGRFISEVRDRINQLLAALKAPLVPYYEGTSKSGHHK